MLSRVLKCVLLILLLSASQLILAQENVKRYHPVIESPASERRVALVIGNANYLGDLRLKNPINDAEAMASTLRNLGFEVLLGTDLSHDQFLDILHEWGDKLKGVQIALFYYSGHGIQLNNVNFLVPIGANPQSAKQVPDKMVDAHKVLDEMADEDVTAKAATNIMILDACRETPQFTRSLNKGSTQKGLAKMEAPANTIIAYATRAGETASDNPDGKNGLYTQELLKQLVEPGLEIDTIFRHTTRAVSLLSMGMQIPARYGTLQEDVYLKKPPIGKEKVPEPETQIIKSTEPVAHIVVTSEPEGATVLIDKKPVGKTPYESDVPLEADDMKTVQVTVLLEGYGLQRCKVPLEIGKTAKIIATLKAKVPDKDPVPPVPPLNGNVPIAENVQPVHGIRINSETLPAVANIGDSWINPIDGAEMIYVSEGPFLMGGTNQEDGKVVHKVTLDGYWIYKNLVTVGMYKKFCNEMKKNMPTPPKFNPGWINDNHPMVRVSWQEAQEYCAWAGVSLPSEAQWEKAARGGLAGKAYPWGDRFNVTKLCCNASGTMAVGSFPENGYGLNDMAGNVWQWCSDWYDKGFYDNALAMELNPENRTANEFHVVRGGSWGNSSPSNFRCACRNHGPEAEDDGVGFRCVARPGSH